MAEYLYSWVTFFNWKLSRDLKMTKVPMTLSTPPLTPCSCFVLKQQMCFLWTAFCWTAVQWSLWVTNVSRFSTLWGPIKTLISLFLLLLMWTSLSLSLFFFFLMSSSCLVCISFLSPLLSLAEQTDYHGGGRAEG